MKFSDDANLQNVFFKFLFHIKKLRVATFTISFAIPISYNFFKIFFTLLTSRRKKKEKNKSRLIQSKKRKLFRFKETKNCANTYISNFMYIVHNFLNIDKQERAVEKSKTRGTNNVLSSSILRVYVHSHDKSFFTRAEENRNICGRRDLDKRFIRTLCLRSSRKCIPRLDSLFYWLQLQLHVRTRA